MKTRPALLCEPRDNQLLAALPEDDLAHWAGALEPVELHLGQVLCESGSTAPYVYFPTTAVVSLLYLTLDGACSEIAVVGRDGLVGVALFMGGNATPSRSVVQSAGLGLRMRAQRVQQEINRPGPIQAMLLRYALSLMAQMAQTAACNRYHSIDQLLCRRLLMGLDRQSSQALMMTQELLANLLGVRREGVTAAALKLSQAGLISYRRGRIAVLDRERLEQQLDRPIKSRLKSTARTSSMPVSA